MNFSLFSFFFLELILKAQETLLYRVCNKISKLVLLMTYELMLKIQSSTDPESGEAYSIRRYAAVVVLAYL